MQIQSTLTNQSGQTLNVFYHEGNPLENLDGKILQAVGAFSFHNGKLVLVYNPKRKSWTPPGGGIEPGETFEDAVIREVREESNMNVLHQEFIGYQDIHEPDRIVRQTRSFCVVEPLGEFVSDPDGDITEIKLIDPKDYKQHFEWGVVGERIMTRALEMHAAHSDKLKNHE